MSLTITDLFCGAGGSGLGATAAGFDLRIAANHWQRAIETHAANFPDTEHDCADTWGDSIYCPDCVKKTAEVEQQRDAGLLVAGDGTVLDQPLFGLAS